MYPVKRIIDQIAKKRSNDTTLPYSGLPAVETVCRPNLVLPRKIHGAALAALVDWMYTGKLTVHRKALGHLPLVANFLKVNIIRLYFRNTKTYS